MALAILWKKQSFWQHWHANSVANNSDFKKKNEQNYCQGNFILLNLKALNN